MTSDRGGWLHCCSMLITCVLTGCTTLPVFHYPYFIPSENDLAARCEGNLPGLQSSVWSYAWCVGTAYSAWADCRQMLCRLLWQKQRGRGSPVRQSSIPGSISKLYCQCEYCEFPNDHFYGDGLCVARQFRGLRALHCVGFRVSSTWQRVDFCMGVMPHWSGVPEITF